MKMVSSSLLILIIGCSTTPRNPASDQQSASHGLQGACGVSGADGIAGHMNVEALYPLYPLCNVASLITSANDSKKLKEYLDAGCRIDVAAMPGSQNSLWDLVVARQEIDLLKIILSDPRVADQVNLYRPIDSKALAKSYLMTPLNAFEVAIYGQTLKHVAADDVPTAIKDLYVSGQQVAMLNLLLAATSDKEKLQAALQRAILDLNGPLGSSPCNQAAVEAVNNRLSELSR